MKRSLILGLALGILAPMTMVGCGETEKTTVKSEGPGGSTTETKEVKVKGDGGPAAGGATTDTAKP